MVGYNYQPAGTYFMGNPGTHTGALNGAGGTDFDVYLWEWNGYRWVTVAQGISPTSNESVTYTNGTSTYYVWYIESYSGTANYTLSMQRP